MYCLTIKNGQLVYIGGQHIINAEDGVLTANLEGGCVNIMFNCVCLYRAYLQDKEYLCIACVNPENSSARECRVGVDSGQLYVINQEE